MYVLEHTGADVPGGDTSEDKINWVDRILYKIRYRNTRLSYFFVPRNVRMAEWPLNGVECCDKIRKKQ